MSAFIVLRRASENTWETIGPTATEMREAEALIFAAGQTGKGNTNHIVVPLTEAVEYYTTKEVRSRPATKNATLEEVTTNAE